jgi:hypothetical protein
MKIAIMSDSHDVWGNLEKAVELANKEGCRLLLFAGDFIAPLGISTLEQFKGGVKLVWGNNEAEKVGLTRKLDASEKIELCGDVYEEEVGGVKIFMNHYPRIAELAAKSGEFDLCIYGHTHEYKKKKIGKCLLLNPGEIQGYVTGKATFVIYDTSKKDFQKIAI